MASQRAHSPRRGAVLGHPPLAQMEAPSGEAVELRRRAARGWGRRRGRRRRRPDLCRRTRSRGMRPGSHAGTTPTARSCRPSRRPTMRMRRPSSSTQLAVDGRDRAPDVLHVVGGLHVDEQLARVGGTLVREPEGGRRGRHHSDGRRAERDLRPDAPAGAPEHAERRCLRAARAAAASAASATASARSPTSRRRAGRRSPRRAARRRAPAAGARRPHRPRRAQHGHS